jgi:hypothetical protein
MKQPVPAVSRYYEAIKPSFELNSHNGVNPPFGTEHVWQSQQEAAFQPPVT